jgi:hypothetical protein
MEAVINSRWGQTKEYWEGPLCLYVIFLILFSSLSYYISSDKGIDKPIRTGIGMFYYIGTYLLTIELMQMKRYKKKYFTIFNMFDLFSIVFGIVIFALLLKKAYNNASGISDELATILTTVTILILWIEMVCYML